MKLRPFFSSNLSSAHKRITPLALVLVLVAPTRFRASAQSISFKSPPVKIPLEVKDQPLSITAWAALTISSEDRRTWLLNVELTGDLADLQRNLGALLGSQLDKDDHCGERLTLLNATLVPIEPASLATIQLHYERWGCVKLLGKQQAKRLVGGDAEVPITLTPAIEANSTELRLIPEVGQIQADGSLGEVLRAGPLGEMIQEKVRNSILSAMQKSANLTATLPPAAQAYATLQSARFKNNGSGDLLVVLDGQAHVTQEQARILANQLKQRLPLR